MLDIDSAIRHCEEVAERQEYLSNQNHGYCEEKWNVQARAECAECASDHRQLAGWLRELKELRLTVGMIKVEDLKSALTLLREYKAENNEMREQIEEYKRLLKAAVGTLNDSSCNKDCHQCKWNNGGCEMSCRFAWIHTDEANKLIGD